MDTFCMFSTVATHGGLWRRIGVDRAWRRGRDGRYEYEVSLLVQSISHDFLEVAIPARATREAGSLRRQRVLGDVTFKVCCTTGKVSLMESQSVYSVPAARNSMRYAASGEPLSRLAARPKQLRPEQPGRRSGMHGVVGKIGEPTA